MLVFLPRRRCWIPPASASRPDGGARGPVRPLPVSGVWSSRAGGRGHAPPQSHPLPPPASRCLGGQRPQGWRRVVGGSPWSLQELLCRGFWGRRQVGPQRSPRQAAQAQGTLVLAGARESGRPRTALSLCLLLCSREEAEALEKELLEDYRFGRQQLIEIWGHACALAVTKVRAGRGWVHAGVGAGAGQGPCNGHALPLQQEQGRARPDQTRGSNRPEPGRRPVPLPAAPAGGCKATAEKSQGPRLSRRLQHLDPARRAARLRRTCVDTAPSARGSPVRRRQTRRFSSPQRAPSSGVRPASGPGVNSRLQVPEPRGRAGEAPSPGSRGETAGHPRRGCAWPLAEPAPPPRRQLRPAAAVACGAGRPRAPCGACRMRPGRHRWSQDGTHPGSRRPGRPRLQNSFSAGNRALN